MNNRAKNRYDRAARIKTFGLENGDDFAPASIAAALLTENAQLVADVDEAKADQLHPRDTGKEVLVDALRLDLVGIARTARTIGRTDPGFSDDYRLPDGPGEGVLRTAGDAILGKLKQPGVPAKFIAHEMDPNFVTHLEGDLKAITDYKENAEGEREESVEATAAIARLVKRGGEIKDTLDTIMHNKYERANPDKLRGWLTASHLQRQPRHGKPPTSETAEEPENDTSKNEDNNPPPAAKS